LSETLKNQLEYIHKIITKEEEKLIIDEDFDEDISEIRDDFSPPLMQ